MESGILPSRKELLSRIELVCDLDTSFIAVTGEAGIGKSALLEFFIEHHCITRIKCFIQAIADQPPHVLLEQILVQLVPGCIYDSRLSLGQNICSAHQGEPLNCIIIIDNAQYVADEVFAQLILLLKNSGEDYQFSVIFAQPREQDRFSQFNSRHPMIEIHLEPLNQAESQMLLAFYYRSMIDGERQQVVQFIERSQGLPAKLLKWEDKASGSKNKLGGISSKSIILIMLTVVMISVLVTAGWFFMPAWQVSSLADIKPLKIPVLTDNLEPKQTERLDVLIKEGKQADANETIINAEQTDSEANLNALFVKKWQNNPEQPIVQSEAIDTQALASNNDIVQQQNTQAVTEQAPDTVVEGIVVEGMVVEDTVTQSSVAENAVNEDIVVEGMVNEDTVIKHVEQLKASDKQSEQVVTHKQSVEKPQSTVKQALAVIEKEDALIPEQATLPIESAATEAAPAPDQEKQQQVHGSLMDNQWFMSQPSSRFVIQLTGVSDPAILETYLIEHQLKNSSHIYQSIRDDKPWYVVTTGDHQNAEAARTAIGVLAMPLRTSQPWIKSISTIQSEITNAKKTK